MQLVANIRRIHWAAINGYHPPSQLTEFGRSRPRHPSSIVRPSTPWSRREPSVRRTATPAHRTPDCDAMGPQLRSDMAQFELAVHEESILEELLSDLV